MLLGHIHEPFMSSRVFLSEWIFGIDITMDIAGILRPRLSGFRKQQSDKSVLDLPLQRWNVTEAVNEYVEGSKKTVSLKTLLT